MNKAELIELLSAGTKMSKVDCKKMIESFVDIVTKALKKGKSVVLTNFGTFSVITRKRRVGINPSTRRKMDIPERKVAKFKAGKKLRKSVHP